MIAGAKFCHQCGARAGGQLVGQQWNWKLVSIFLVGVAVWSFALMFAALKWMPEKNAVKINPHTGVTLPSEPSVQSVDLSTMTPREAADRLFNRVMAADEQGRSEEVTQFAPMTLEAYKLVDPLDADARYHIGLISLLLGDLDNVREQIKNLQREAPDHLLGLTLAYKVAEQMGDDKTASAARARFAAAYETEIRSGRPEYEAHSVTIEAFRASAMGANANGTSSRMENPSRR
jgi:hypothetical protein